MHSLVRADSTKITYFNSRILTQLWLKNLLIYGNSISNDKRNCKELPNINYEFPFIVTKKHHLSQGLP